MSNSGTSQAAATTRPAAVVVGHTNVSSSPSAPVQVVELTLSDSVRKQLNTGAARLSVR